MTDLGKCENELRIVLARINTYVKEMSKGADSRIAYAQVCTVLANHMQDTTHILQQTLVKLNDARG